MTEKDIRKLNRKQLLELLLRQTERADRLQERLAQAEQRLQDRTLAELEAGSIAEASLKLNGVFESAQAAAAQYIENVRRLHADQERMIQQAEEEARRRGETILAEVEQQCARREAAAEKKMREIAAHIQQLQKQKKVLDDMFLEFVVK